MTKNMVSFFQGMKPVEVTYLIKLLNKWETAGQVVSEAIFPFVLKEACVAALKHEGSELELCEGKPHLVNKLLGKLSHREESSCDSFDMFLNKERLIKVYKEDLVHNGVIRFQLPTKRKVECGIQYSYFGNRYKKPESTVFLVAEVRHVRKNLFKCSVPKGASSWAKEYLHEKFGL